MKIKDIPVNERPREKLIEYGSSYLSDSELLAIILKQGTRRKSAKEIGIEIINSIDSITDLETVTLERLLKIDGIGRAQALTILSTIELGKRIFKKKNYKDRIKLTNSKEVYNYIKYLLENKDQEYFYCIYVNTKKQVIERKLLFMGTINKSMVHPREIFKHAYLNSASGIFCIHNHPSGDPTPSKDDIFLTKSLVEVGSVNNIPVLDHMIIGEDCYYSFFEDGKIINL